MTLSALDKHFAKMNAASSAPKRSTSPRRRSNGFGNNSGSNLNGNGNLNVNINGSNSNQRSSSPNPTRQFPRRSRSARNSASSEPPKLSPLKIDEDHSTHFGRDDDDEVSINTTNTANIRISRKARGDADAKGEVRTKNLVKNFRLSRNHSRVLYSRSPSPSRKLLAAEIAVAAARREMAGPYIPEPPPLEQTPLLLMRFTNKATSKMISLVENRLRKSGLIIYDKVEDTDEPHYTYLYLSAAQEALETFAEQIRWMKRTNDTKVVEYFTVPNRRKFITKKKKRGAATNAASVHRSNSIRNLRGPDSNSDNKNDAETSSNKNCMGGDELFTSNEWCHLAFRLLDSVEVWLENESSKDLNLMLMLRDENSVPPPPPPSSPSMNGNKAGSGHGGPPSSRPVFTRSGSSSRNVNKASKGSMPNRRAFRRQTSMGNLTGGGSSRNLMGGGGGPSAGGGTGPGGTGFNRRQNFHRQKSIMMQRVSQHGKRSSCLRHVLQANEFVDVVTPLHWGPARKAIVTETLTPNQLMPPVQDIRNYYGEDVAFYFAWMGTLSNWLVVLGGMGAFTAALQWIRNDELDEDEFTPMYGLFTFLWGVLFLRFWERHEHRLAYRWGTYSLSLYDKQKCLTTRPEFKGKLRISPVTGDYETYYPTHKRRIQYTISALVTMVMLGVAFWMMIISLNMQGFVHPERNPERWNDDNPHPFHYPGFAVLSEKGYIFDATHQWKSFLPSVLHVALIFTLNNIYRVIAEMLTEWENHETEASYRTSLIVKRFMFEAFDCYVALFYLAFYERDVDRLHMELVTVFNIDTFRRLAMECFIPLTVQKISKWLNPHQHHHLVSEADEELAEDAEEAAMFDDSDATNSKSKMMMMMGESSGTNLLGESSCTNLLGESSNDLLGDSSDGTNTRMGDSTTDLLGESSPDLMMMGDSSKPLDKSIGDSSKMTDRSLGDSSKSAAVAFKQFVAADQTRTTTKFDTKSGGGRGASPSSVATASTGSSSESDVILEEEPPASPKKKTTAAATTNKAAAASSPSPSNKPPKRRKSGLKSLIPSSKHGSASQMRALEDMQVGYKPPTMEELAEEAELDEYEAFDDYMEIVIQFGYVTLFASAYPLASLVALAANWVEIRSDCFKLARVCRRPRSFRADGIGVWKTLLSCVVWMSALTNCLIVGFTSDQMREIFPAFYMEDKHGDSHLVHDKGWIAVFVIFGLERILIILGLLIYAIVPEVPEDVHDEVERLHYIRAQEHEEVLRQVMRKRAHKKKQ